MKPEAREVVAVPREHLCVVGGGLMVITALEAAEGLGEGNMKPPVHHLSCSPMGKSSDMAWRWDWSAVRTAGPANQLQGLKPL